MIRKQPSQKSIFLFLLVYLVVEFHLQSSQQQKQGKGVGSQNPKILKGKKCSVLPAHRFSKVCCSSLMCSEGSILPHISVQASNKQGEELLHQEGPAMI